MANDGAWHVNNSSGDVSVTTPGVQQIALTVGAILKPGEKLRTGRNGRVLLVRGEQTMLIAPNSVISIPTEYNGALSTTIIQQAGSILLKVEKRNVKHFGIETPHLAAVVKGTQFRVTVNKNDTRVDVFNGLVEVTDLKSGQYALVQPGQTARVSARGPVGLSPSGSGTLSPIPPNTPRRSSVNPLPVPEKGSAPDSTPRGQPIRVVATPGAYERPSASSERSADKENMRTFGFVVPEMDFDNAKRRLTRQDEETLFFTIAFSLTVGVGVSAVVAGHRRRQRRKQEPT
jgi:hypothetical protein